MQFYLTLGSTQTIIIILVIHFFHRVQVIHEMDRLPETYRLASLFLYLTRVSVVRREFKL